MAREAADESEKNVRTRRSNQKSPKTEEGEETPIFSNRSETAPDL